MVIEVMTMKIKKYPMEKLTDGFINIILLFAMAITTYPFIYVISMSISDPLFVMRDEIWLLPKGFSLHAYKMVFENPDIWRSYYNTVWYTGVGTFFNVLMTVLAAYPLARKNFVGRNFLVMFIAVTMFFSGGLIPTFILVNKMGLYNTRWAIILPGIVSAWNIIIARTFFENIPESLHESAMLDGANDIKVLFKIILPISMPILSVLVLFYAVAHWNSYFSALVYLPNKDLQPLQVYLAKVLIDNSDQLLGDMEGSYARNMYGIQLKYAAIIVATLPILFAYPFLQKYFVKGVMIGAIKG